MLPRLLIGGLAITLVSSVAAQQPTSPAPPATPAAAPVQQDDTSLKNQIRTFEVLLKGAVESGGQKLATWAGPTVTLAPAADPVVVSTLLPDDGYAFIVQIPEILPISIALYDLQRRRPIQASPAPAETKVSGAGVVRDDPMAPPAAGSASGGGSTTADAQYSEFVRQGLYDAILDSSAILPIKPGQWLTVTAIAVDVAVTNAFYRNPSRKLILSIKGDDLLALRQKTISREQARERINERRF